MHVSCSFFLGATHERQKTTFSNCSAGTFLECTVGHTQDIISTQLRHSLNRTGEHQYAGVQTGWGALAALGLPP